MVYDQTFVLVKPFHTANKTGRYAARVVRRMIGVGRHTCDVVLLEGVAVDLVLVGTVLLQPLAHVLLRPQGHRLGQLDETRLPQQWDNHTVAWSQTAYIVVQVHSICSDPAREWLEEARRLFGLHRPLGLRSHDVSAARSLFIVRPRDKLMV